MPVTLKGCTTINAPKSLLFSEQTATGSEETLIGPMADSMLSERAKLRIAIEALEWIKDACNRGSACDGGSANAAEEALRKIASVK